MKNVLIFTLAMLAAFTSYAQGQTDEATPLAKVEVIEEVVNTKAAEELEKAEKQCKEQCLGKPNKAACYRICLSSQKEILRRKEAMIVGEVNDDPTGVSNYVMPKEHEEEAKGWSADYQVPQPTGEFPDFPDE